MIYIWNTVVRSTVEGLILIIKRGIFQTSIYSFQLKAQEACLSQRLLQSAVSPWPACLDQKQNRYLFMTSKDDFSSCQIAITTSKYSLRALSSFHTRCGATLRARNQFSLLVNRHQPPPRLINFCYFILQISSFALQHFVSQVLKCSQLKNSTDGSSPSPNRFPKTC